MNDAIGRASLSALRVWPLVAASALTIFSSLPMLAPVLLAANRPDAALAIYTFYRFTCHQWAHRSFFLLGQSSSYEFYELESAAGPDGPFGYLGSPELGYKMAYCERDVAIYGAAAIASLLFLVLRRQIHPLGGRWYLVLLTPLVLDGLSQLLGWRESTPLLRVVTGALFGLASVWFIFPRVDVILSAMIESRRAPTRTAGRTSHAQ